MKSGVSAMAVALVVSLVGCGDHQSLQSGSRNGSGGKLQVVTTVAPITSIAASVAGDLATVTGVVPEGTNSHTFEPPPRIAKVLSRADLIFINGLKLEDPTQELAEGNLKQGAEIVELGNRAISEEQYIFDSSFPKEGGKPNPHLWTNPPMAKRYGEVIAQELASRDAENTDRYQQNYESFAAKVEELSKAMKTATATVPPERRKLLTYHDGYAYFGRDYGWKIIGAIQPSTFDEPTPQEVANLIRQVTAERVPAIFGSEVFPSPVLERIGKEAEVRYVDVLRDDDLPGEPGKPEHSWLGLMRFNYVTMVRSMGGDPSVLEAVRLTSASKDEATYPQ